MAATINAYTFPSLGRVLVEVTWFDYPTAKCIRVQRTNSSTGEVVALRDYVYPCGEFGEYQTLSGSRALFWDMEMPFGVSFTYTADAINSSGVATAATGPAISTGAVTISDGGFFWLRDPVRPCNDLQIGLCFGKLDPACNPVGGIGFIGEDAETYDPNAAFVYVTNARRPIPINRERRDAASMLTFLTKLFSNRDAMLQLAEAGGPLRFTAPAAYGIPDRYISAGTVTVSRMKVDHRKPVRIVEMPFTVVDRPVGTTQGICDSRFQDQCDVYATWNAMNTDGLSWTDLMYGAGGGASLGFRHWNPGVENVFANWLAVENHGTWGQLKTGA